jgi:hypothetical protein
VAKSTRILTHQRFKPQGETPDSSIRELMAVREIAHAFLHADRPEEVFQFALERVGPLVGASFASIYLVDGASELMRLVASYNWPERYRPWLGQMRVRLGFGPSGESAAERRVIEVPDVAADADLEDWREVAQELGFRSLVARRLIPQQDAGHRDLLLRGTRREDFRGQKPAAHRGRPDGGDGRKGGSDGRNAPGERRTHGGERRARAAVRGGARGAEGEG